MPLVSPLNLQARDASLPDPRPPSAFFLFRFLVLLKVTQMVSLNSEAEENFEKGFLRGAEAVMLPARV